MDEFARAPTLDDLRLSTKSAFPGVRSPRDSSLAIACSMNASEYLGFMVVSTQKE